MLERELEVATHAATRAGEAVRAIYEERDDYEVTQKSGGRGPLTEADLAANTIIIETLLSAFPDDAILSEETADSPARLKNTRCWIIDPLDGTREFTMGIPEFVVSIGLSIDGQAKLGVLFNPATEELFTGVVGVGATYNRRPCHVSDHATIEGSRLLVSRSEHAKGWFEDYEDTAKLRPCGSVAYKFGLVAAGLAEATFTPKPRNEWDLIGGVACVLAAGGRCSDGKRQPYSFNRPDPLHHGVVGTNGPIFDAILDLMNR